MTTEYYTASGTPSTSAQGASAAMRGEFSLVEAGFAKLPTLLGNGSLSVFVNAGATGMEAVSAATARGRLGLAIGTNVQAYDADLDALAALAATAGMLSRTGAGAFAVRTLTGTANEITVANGDGSAAAPTFSLPATLTFTGKTVTGGTFNAVTLTGSTLTNPPNTTQALVDAASVAWDMDSGATATLLATGAVGATRAVAAPSHIKTGGRYVLHFTQDATGGRALTFNAVFKNQGDASTIPAPSQAASAVTCYVFESPDGANLRLTNYYKKPTRTVLTSGTAATYTTPAGVTRINVRAVGGGGGGGAVSTNAGASGTATTFSTLSAGGGAGGQVGTTGVNGGTASGGDINISGGQGCGCSNSSGSFSPPGGIGGTSIFGGAGRSDATGQGGNAAANSGAGGGGGGGNGTAGSAGGGAGAYCEKLIVSPSATYTYTVGAKGLGGAAGTTAGGNGADGIIIIDEYYD